MPALDESNLEVRLKGLGLWLTEAAVEKLEPAGPARAQIRDALAAPARQAAAAGAD